MPRLALGLVLTALLCVSCTGGPPVPSAPDYVLLVPDWKNHVVHRIALDGAYEGDFLDASRADDPKVSRTFWSKPLGVLYLDGNPGRFWLTAGRAVGEWDGHGRFVRAVRDDSTVLEVPTCIVRVGDEIFIASADTKDMHVFGLDGAPRRIFGYPEMYRANDCKVGPDGMIYVGSTLRNTATPGVVSIWDPKDTGESAKPRAYRIPGTFDGDGTYWVHGLAFDDDGNLLITEFPRGRLERWNLETNERVAALLDSDQAGAYLKLERGPDGRVYMVGPAGVYRFDARATPESLKDLKPFFDARQLDGRYPQPFSPSGIAFAPRSALAAER